MVGIHSGALAYLDAIHPLSHAVCRPQRKGQVHTCSYAYIAVCIRPKIVFNSRTYTYIYIAICAMFSSRSRAGRTGQAPMTTVTHKLK